MVVKDLLVVGYDLSKKDFFFAAPKALWSISINNYLATLQDTPQIVGMLGVEEIGGRAFAIRP